jgi:hypothetical protein
MLCHRGCGLPVVYTNYKRLGCCSNITQHCPIVKEKIGAKTSAALKGRPATDAQLNGLAKGRNGRKLSAETIEKIRQGNLQTKSKQQISPWNKGLTKEDPRVEKYAAKQRGTRRKIESAEILSRNDPAYSDFRKYRNRVSVRTKETYKLHKNIINPNNLMLGKCGIEGAHQIDHIITVREGFEKGLPIELISAKENLQILSWLENVQKYDGKEIRKNSKRK